MAKKKGRPEIQIDQSKFESLCISGCKLYEIADYFGCEDDKINRWCKKTYKVSFVVISSRLRSKGKTNITERAYDVLSDISKNNFDSNKRLLLQDYIKKNRIWEYEEEENKDDVNLSNVSDEDIQKVFEKLTK